MYHLLKNKTELATILTDIRTHQQNDSKIQAILHRLAERDEKITQYYCIHDHLLFIKAKQSDDQWKVVIPKSMEKDITIDYHIRYGHMGAMKVVKALEEHVYFQDMNRTVRRHIKHCHLCQLVKCNNEKKEGVMIPITSTEKLEKVFVDILSLIHI